jgi:hypothetical protein
VNTLYSMPMVAVVPLFVLWFGFDVSAKAVVVFLFRLFPIRLLPNDGGEGCGDGADVSPTRSGGGRPRADEGRGAHRPKRPPDP